MAGKELNSLSHLDIFILMKTAINFATQTPTFTETQRSYLLPGGAHHFAVPAEGGGTSSEGKRRNPLRGPHSVMPKCPEAPRVPHIMKMQV